MLPDALGQHSVQVSQKNGSCGVDTLLGPAHALDAAVLLDGLKIRLCEAGVRVDGEVMLHLGDGIAFQLLRNGFVRCSSVSVSEIMPYTVQPYYVNFNFVLLFF